MLTDAQRHTRQVGNSTEALADHSHYEQGPKGTFAEQRTLSGSDREAPGSSPGLRPFPTLHSVFDLSMCRSSPAKATRLAGEDNPGFSMLPTQLVVAPSSSARSTRRSHACHSSSLHPRRSVSSTYAWSELTTRRMSRARSLDSPLRRAPS